MVEHGIVPKDTELIAGVVFWKKPSTGRPTLEELCAQITDEQRDGNREL
jgi:hypothetical protein